MFVTIAHIGKSEKMDKSGEPAVAKQKSSMSISIEEMIGFDALVFDDPIC